MKWLSVAITLLMLMPSSEAASQPAVDSARVQEDVKTLIYALHDGDVDTIIRFTPPKVIEMSGGVDTMKHVLQSVSQGLREMGTQIQMFTFPEPPTFLEGGGRRFAVVPTLQLLTAKGQKVESLNFQLGILEQGGTQWVYVEGSRLNKQNIQTLFPGFPADYAFPPFYRKKR